MAGRDATVVMMAYERERKDKQLRYRKISKRVRNSDSASDLSNPSCLISISGCDVYKIISQ
jgi:hypothetical protein